MRRVIFPYWRDGEWWFISPWSGSLFRSSERPCDYAYGRIISKVEEAINICDKPYSCHWNPDVDRHDSERLQDFALSQLGRIFILLGNRRFRLATSLAGFNVGIYETTRDAFIAISGLHGLSGSDDRCLQRSLLAAMVSKSFIKSGVVLIGAELSTGEMHAWIIENGAQPDPEDRSWINYRPLLALYNQHGD